MKALSSLSKFKGIHDEWKKLIEKFDLKWTNSNYTNNTFFKIFNPEAADMSKMIQWLKDTVRQLPDKYSNILLFATLTGLRPSECWHSIRLIQNDKGHYVSKDKLLHYQYPDIFLRRTKKVFISLVSEQIIEIAEKADIKRPYPQLCKIFRSMNLSMNMYYCRKIFATYLRDKGIESEIIDLLQGRIPKSMFLRHYYRPDINEIITKRLRPVLDELRKDLLD
jgi:intergrase/recombinase